MDHKAEAERIYAESMKRPAVGGDRAFYKYTELNKLHQQDRWIVRQHLNNISTSRMKRSDSWQLKRRP